MQISQNIQKGSCQKFKVQQLSNSLLSRLKSLLYTIVDNFFLNIFSLFYRSIPNPFFSFFAECCQGFSRLRKTNSLPSYIQFDPLIDQERQPTVKVIRIEKSCKMSLLSFDLGALVFKRIYLHMHSATPFAYPMNKIKMTRHV